MPNLPLSRHIAYCVSVRKTWADERYSFISLQTYVVLNSGSSAGEFDNSILLRISNPRCHHCYNCPRSPCLCCWARFPRRTVSGRIPNYKCSPVSWVRVNPSSFEIKQLELIHAICTRRILHLRASTLLNLMYRAAVSKRTQQFSNPTTSQLSLSPLRFIKRLYGPPRYKSAPVISVPDMVFHETPETAYTPRSRIIA